MGGFTAVWAVIAGIVFQIWARPGPRALWLIFVGVCLLAALWVEVVFRLDYVKLAGGRLRWRIRVAGRGDRALSDVRGVTRLGTGAVIDFGGGDLLVVGDLWFRPSDIERLVGAMEGASRS